jgi:pyruvate formate lyase activating enzyme
VELPYYGRITALARDPIEKKPLYHWRPGSSIVSVGFSGCNLHCPFCQNWHISQIGEGNSPEGSPLNPDELIAEVRASGFAAGQAAEPDTVNRQIAYTYSEPLVHAEYLVDCMEEARREGIANVLVTNGCVNAEAAEEILSRTNAANIDLKCFSEKTYAAVLKGNLPAVLDFIRMAVLMGVHTEITTLVVPGLNDGRAELSAIAEFIAGQNPSIPWHLSAYHPDWKWTAPPTDPAALSAMAEHAGTILSHVYTGNIAGKHNDTLCRHCGGTLVTRRNYRINAEGLCRDKKAGQKKDDHGSQFYRCAGCGAPSPIRWM